MVHYIRGEHRLLMKRLAIFSVLFIFLISATWGDTYTWTGDVDDDWNNSGNWSDSGYPLPATYYPGENPTNDIVTININQTINITDNLNNLASLEINEATLNIDGYLSEVGALTIGTSGAQIDASGDDLSVSGMTTLNGNLILTGTDKLKITDLTAETGVVVSGAVSMDDWTVTINAIGVTLTGGNTNIGILNVNDNDVFITATAGAVTQTGAITTTKTLELNSSGAITLNSAANSVAKLKVTSALETVEFTNNAALEIAGVSGLTGAPASQIVKITTTGTDSNITQSGAIETTGTLELKSSDAITLNIAGNEVAILKITGAGEDVEFTNIVDLEITGVSDSGNVKIINTGDITQSGPIETNGTLELSANEIDISSITANQIILKAVGGTVTVAELTAFSNGKEDEDAAIFVVASSFTANGGSGKIQPGTGQLCLNVSSYTINVDDVVDNHYHTHGAAYSGNAHLVYYTDANTPADFLNTYNDDKPINFVESSTASPSFTVGSDFNIFIVNVVTTIDGDFETTGTGFIEIRGSYTADNDLTLDSVDDVRLNNAIIDLATGDFDVNSGQLTLTGIANAITATNISLYTVDSDNATAKSLELTGIVTITGDVGATRPVGIFEITGNSTISGDVKTTGEQTYTGNITLAGASTQEFTSSGGSVSVNGRVLETTPDIGLTVNAFEGISISTTANRSDISGDVTLNNNQPGTASGNISFFNNSAYINLTANNAADSGTVTIDQTGSLIVLTAGVTSSGGEISLTGTTGVTVNGEVASSGGIISLIGAAGVTVNNAIDTTDGGTVTGAEIKLTSTGGVVSGLGILTGTELTVNALEGILIGDTDNRSAIDGDVTLNKNQTGTATGNISFFNSSTSMNLTAKNDYPVGSITVDQIGSLIVLAAGVTSSGEEISLTGDDITVNGEIISLGGEISLVGINGIVVDNNINTNDGTTGAPINLTSTGGEITGTGQLTGTILTVVAKDGISLENAANNVAEVSLTNSATGGISYKNDRTAGLKILKAVNDAAISITEATGNISIDNSINPAISTDTEDAEVEITAAGSITVTGNIGSPGDKNGIVILKAENNNISINETINCYSLALIAENGKVEINEKIYVSSDEDEGLYAAVYILANEFSGTGEIILLSVSGEVCVTIDSDSLYTGDVTNDRIHYHAIPNRHIVYRTGTDDETFFNVDITAGNYWYIQAELDLGPVKKYSTSGTGNIYIIDVGDVNFANERTVDFSTASGGFIEVRGAYTSDGTLNLNSNDVYFVDGTSGSTALDLPSFDLTGKTLHLHGGTSTAASIKTSGDIKLGVITIDNSTNGINHLTLDSGGIISVDDTVGNSTSNRVGNIVVKGNVAFNKTVFANSYTQSAGSVTISADHNYYNEFSLTNSNLKINNASIITNNSAMGITVSGNSTETEVIGTVVLNTQAANGTISLTTVTGTGSLEMTAAAGVINISGQIGIDRDTRIGDLKASAGNVTFSADVFANNVEILNSGLYTQDESVTAYSFKQTGSGTVSLKGDINVTAADPNDAKIEFISTAEFLKNLTFSVPSTGGFVDLAQGVNGVFKLTLDGGSSSSAYLELLKDTGFKGDVEISAGSYVKISSGKTITQNGTNLTLRAGTTRTTTLDTSAGSWHMGGVAGTLDEFEGISGILTLGGVSDTLTLDTGSKLIGNHFNLTGITVNNTGWATISAKGDVDIGASVNFTGDHPYLILEMAGNGDQNLITAKPLGSLHVNSGSTTNLTQNITITGEAQITYSGVLNADIYDIVMMAGLVSTKDGVGAVMLGRWEIIGAPEDITGGNGSSRNMYAFKQDDTSTRSVTFERLPTSTDPVFFEIIGNTVWQKFVCHEPGTTFQFSMEPHHHVFLNTFEITGGASDYILLTRLPTTAGWVYDDQSTNKNGINGYTYPPPNTYNGSIHGLPSVPASRTMKTDQNRDKFWNFNLIPSNDNHMLMNISCVTIYFSHAWYQRVPIAPDKMQLNAVPFYSVSNLRGFYNYDWVEVRKIIYSYAEDGNGNGKVDRIRVQTTMPLNGNFSGFQTAVEGFKNDTVENFGYAIVYDKVDSVNREEEDRNSFYIYLQEGPWLYNGQSLSWRITKNETLKDTISQESVGDPDGEIYYTINTIPPRVSFALTLPGHDQTFVKISQPVQNSGVTITGDEYASHTEIDTTAPYQFVLEYRPVNSPQKLYNVPVPGGGLSYRLKLNNSPSVSDLAKFPRIGEDPAAFYFNMDGYDLGVRALDWRDENIDSEFYLYYPSPRYPMDWNYSGYRTFAGNEHVDSAYGLSTDDSGNPTNIFVPPNRMLTPEMIRSLHDYAAEAKHHENNTKPRVTPADFAPVVSDGRRITDVLVSMTPTSADSDNYFAWPVWARYKDTAIQNPGENFREQQSIDIGIIWAFDGTKNLEDRDFTLQARINNTKLGGFTGLSLFYGFDVPIKWREPAETGVRGKSAGGLWLPYTNIVNPPYDANPLFNIVPSETLNSGTGLLTFYPAHKPQSSPSFPLFTFDIIKDIALSTSGGKIDFLLRLEGDSTVDPHLFIARLDAPAGADLNSLDWWNKIRPFSFDIQNIRLQRGGVTILNNVINSNNREVTYIRYNLVRSGRVTIQVYTLDGTLVKSIRRNEQRSAGEWTDTWDGSNNGGRPVARGMYFVRVVGPDIDEIRKIMVVK